MNIERILVWFKDGNEQLLYLNEDFFGISNMLNRLLNEKYTGKKIKFINLDFSTNRTYELHPVLPKDTSHYYGGHLRFYGVFDIVQFRILNWNDKKHYVWERACDYIRKSAKETKNEKLLDAVNHAYSKGLEENLNPNYRLLDLVVSINNRNFRVSLWILFQEDGMYSKLTIESDIEIIFERVIDKTRKGVEVFLEMYKVLEFDGKNVIIKGRKDVDYLPLTVPLPEFIILASHSGS